jgi:FtsZ-binding cell division protein ZapB
MSNHDELIEWLESCDAARDSGEAELLLSKAAAAIRELVAERDALKLQANVLRQEKDCACAERDALKAENERLLEEVAQLCGYDNYAEMAALAGGRSE